MVDFGTSDKLLLLSQIEPEANSADEEEIFQGVQKPAQRRFLSRARTSTKSDLFDETLQHQPDTLALKGNSNIHNVDNSSSKLGDASAPNNKCANGYKFMILNLTFLFNGISFGLFMYSREHFTALFELSPVMSTNIVLANLLFILLGNFIGNFSVDKFERFYLLFLCAIVSSICLPGMVLSKSLAYVLIFICLFGLCMGLTNTIGLKWTLSSTSKRIQNRKSNILVIQAIFGMILFFSVFTTFLHAPSMNSHADYVNNNSFMATTTPKVHLKKPGQSDGSYLEQDHVTKPTAVERRRKRQFAPNYIEIIEKFNATSNLTTTSSTKKVHLKKPSDSDGSYLEQSHITKPYAILNPINYDNDLIKTSQTLRECLQKLDRSCQLNINNCKSIATETLLNTTQVSCEFNYNSGQNNLISKESSCTDLVTTHRAIENEKNCFYKRVESLGSLLELNRQDDFKCLLSINTDNSKLNTECNAEQQCEYQTALPLNEQKVSQEVEKCFRSNMANSEKTTTTSTSTPTKTSSNQTTVATKTSSSPATSTTTQQPTTTSSLSTPPTITLFNLSSSQNNTSSTNIVNGFITSSTNKIFSIYKITSKLEHFYFLLSFMYMSLAILHSLMLLQVIKSLLIRFVLCCCTLQTSKTINKSSNVSYHRANNRDSNSIPLLSLKSPYSNTDTESRSFTCQEAIDNFHFWVIISIMFMYGGILMNFLFLMSGYLSHNHDNFVLKTFLLSFMLGRCAFVLLISKQKISDTDSSSPSLSRANIYHRTDLDATSFLKSNFKLLTISSLITVLSVIQLTPAGVSPVSNSATATFGVLYPMLLSFIVPMLLNLCEATLLNDNKAKYISSYITTYLMQSSVLGGVVITFINNNVIRSLFKDGHVFIVCNATLSIGILIMLFVAAAMTKQRAKKQNSDLQLDDTKNVSKGLNKMPEDIEDDHDEEVVLMVHPSEPKDNVVPYND